MVAQSDVIEPGNTPLWQWPATALAQAYRKGALSPVDVLRACMERTDQVQPRLNAFVARREAVWDEARESLERLRGGRALSALDGVPISVKDNLCTADMPTVWGSPALKAHPPEARDEWPVARLRASGALIVGKTNVPEFTLEGYTDNPVFGPTRNPWNLCLTPGGSSGGAVASVAAGCTPLALGTDGGGSIRRPASYCGLVGFKPSIGSVPRGDGLPSLLLDFEVVGPMARTVADARLLYNTLRGPDPRDRTSLACEAATADAAIRADAYSLRVLYVPTLGGAPVERCIAESCEAAALGLRDLGHTVTKGPLDLDIDALTTVWPQVGQIGLATLFTWHPEWRELASAKYQGMADQGAALNASALWHLWEAVDRLRRDCVAFFEHFDVIAMPSAAALPWPAQEAFPPLINGQVVGPRGHAVFTGWVNAAGLPAVSVPVNPDPSGLPIGLQLIGPYGADDMVLALAQAYENQRSWSNLWPAL
jgi:aspartyl-tRNA(Asn)/glutamyl-tRNA(Gln) amidotransferase subunit A